ncbi:MAG: FAD-dependent monooxygenase [Proteobacteria bacterium]|nr:FAD-dependent monooxygenase [Pseudomonadota bacterium]
MAAARATAHSEPVIIAGGGIGGLALALALARLGQSCVIAERRQEWSEAGAGIQLSPNGVKVLRLIGAADGLAPLAAAPEAIRIRDAASAVLLQEVPLGRWIAERHGAPYWVAHRRDLQAALVDQVAREPLIRVERGFEVVQFEDLGSGVRVASPGGSMLAGAALVGADGVFSRIRRQLLGTSPPVYAGWTAARTVVDAQTIDSECGLVDAVCTGVWLSGQGHVVHYPVRAGAEIAVVVVQREPEGDHGWSVPAKAVDIEGALQRFAPAFARALGRGREWRRWALFQTAPLQTWSRGRVTLLGDAAHPTLPFLAQGGSLALEDAASLAAKLADSSESGIAAALDSYQRERAGRARKVVAAAARNGSIFHLPGPAALVRNAAMKVIPGERVARRFDWVYGWEPPHSLSSSDH